MAGLCGPFPTLALLKGGTMNTIARNIPIRSGAEKMLSHIVERYHAGVSFPVVERNVMLVDGRAGFIFGNAGIARFLELYYEGGNSSPVKALGILARLVASAILGTDFVRDTLGFTEIHITADGERVARDQYTMVGVSTVADLGLGFRPFHAVDQNPDHMQLIGMGCSLIASAGYLPRIRLAMPTGHPKVEDRVARSLRFIQA